MYMYTYIYAFIKTIGDVFKYWFLNFKWCLSTSLHHLLMFHSVPSGDRAHDKIYITTNM